LVLVAVIFGVFVSLLDATIVYTAIPKIQAALGGSLHEVSYIATAYTLAAAVAVGATPYLAGRFGTKRVYLTSLALFTLGSALCGLAPSLTLLIAFRVLQGAGGAALFPLSISLLFATFPPEERGLANGIFGIPVLFAPAIGPTLGGYIVEYLDWPIIFYVNVPIGILGLLVGLRVLPDIPPRPGLRFDLRGFLLLGSGSGLLLYGLTNLASDGWGSLSTVSGPTLLGVGLLLAYVALALVTPEPLLDLRLFKDRNYAIGNVVQWLATVGVYGGSFLLPQYLQNLRGLDPYTAGLDLLPLGLAAMGATLLAGFLYNRISPPLLVMTGAVLMVLSTYWLGQWSTLTSPYAALTPLLILRGLSIPVLLQTTNTLAMQDIPRAALDGASTLNVATRQIAASLGIAALTTHLQTQTIVHTGDLAAQVSLSNPATAALYSKLVSIFTGHGLTLQQAQNAALVQLWRLIQQQATALAYQDVYTATALFVLPAIVLALFLRPRPRAAMQLQETPASEPPRQPARAGVLA
jgi:DHA2 family multidrug resistance protein